MDTNPSVNFAGNQKKENSMTKWIDACATDDIDEEDVGVGVVVAVAAELEEPARAGSDVDLQKEHTDFHGIKRARNCLNSVAYPETLELFA